MKFNAPVPFSPWWRQSTSHLPVHRHTIRPSHPIKHLATGRGSGVGRGWGAATQISSTIPFRKHYVAACCLHLPATTADRITKVFYYYYYCQRRPQRVCICLGRGSMIESEYSSSSRLATNTKQCPFVCKKKKKGSGVGIWRSFDIHAKKYDTWCHIYERCSSTGP